MPDTLDLLSRRRSVPVPAMQAPGPSGDELNRLLTIASRVPDHGRLKPWRFVVLEGEARGAFGDRLAEIAASDNPDAAEAVKEKERSRFVAPLIVAVVSSPVSPSKIPEWEQVLSAGAVCMNLITAAHAMGYGANWLTGWFCYDDRTRALLGVTTAEKVAGFVHIGTPGIQPADRERPQLSEIVTRWHGA